MGGLGERNLLDNAGLVEACPSGRSTSVLHEEDFIFGSMPISYLSAESLSPTETRDWRFDHTKRQLRGTEDCWGTPL